MQFCTTNHNELKKKWVDFVKINLHLNDSYIKWICMMQVELELNSNTSHGIQIELNWIMLNPNSILIQFVATNFNSNQIEFNQIMKIQLWKGTC